MASALLWSSSAEKLFLYRAIPERLRTLRYCIFHGKGRKGKRHLAWAVSYTHLDVYKRQSEYYTHLASCHKLPTTSQPSPEQFERLYLDAVSYTHLYRGQADRAAFAAALPRCTMPVCYNGDITTAAQLHALEEEFPALSGIMVGRGLIADPALFRRARGGAPATKEELRGYLTDLYHGYTELFGSAGCAISRMKGHWFYLIHCFAGAEKLEKQLKKLREPWEYEVVVNQIFTLPLVEND